MAQETGFVAIDELARLFDVSPQTIRRDVNLLCERGLLRRIHGGVGRPAVDANLSYSRREVLDLAAKQLIAQRVALFIPDGASLMIGLGTTPAQVALALRGHRGLRVVSNSLNVINALADLPDVELNFAGGTLRPGDLDVVGEPAAAFFAQFKADFGIYGVGGIDDDGTLLDFTPAEVQARAAIHHHCRCSLLVADVSKFGRPALARGGRLADVDHLFVDSPVPQSHVALLGAGLPALHEADLPVERAR